MTQNTIICENCGCEEHGGSPFCSNCGKLLDASGYTGKEIYQQYEQRIMRMVENLKNHPHYDILWDETLDLYAAKAEKFQSILRTEILDIKNADIDKQFEDFLNACRYPEFQIAFVGTIKTGKSTLINALLGSNYASTAVTPETAALTKFRSSEKDYVSITFFSRTEWDELWKSRTSGADKFTQEYNQLNAASEKNKWVGHGPIRKELQNSEIKKELALWSSSKSPVHFFVKEIEVGISSLPDDIPKQVVFVDTPGLSDPVAYRSEISKNYIKRANAVFVCMEAKKLEQGDRETIASVLSFSAHNKEKVFIVATHWDMLNYPVKDWAELRPYLADKLTGKGFYETSQMADRNILYSAALIHNLCRDYDKLEKSDLLPLRRFAISMDIDSPFTDTALQKLDEFSNIHNISSVIRDRLVKNYSKLLYGDLKKQYDQIAELLKRDTDEQRNRLQGLMDTTGKKLEDIVQKLEEKKQGAKEIEERSDQLRSVLDAVKLSTDKRIAFYQSLINGLST